MSKKTCHEMKQDVNLTPTRRSDVQVALDRMRLILDAVDTVMEEQIVDAEARPESSAEYEYSIGCLSLFIEAVKPAIEKLEEQIWD